MNTEASERRAIIVTGLVQGVGFRPFVHRLASRLDLCGYVKNAGGAVLIEVQGDPRRLDHFVNELCTQPPFLSRIDEVRSERQPLQDESSFTIASSDLDLSEPVCIPADMATCDECLAELFDPTDRRYRYPFLNCTHCGPRLTIIQCGPYDRARTTMAPFVMCAACRAEYDAPSNRRFHAQATACATCGPQLALLDNHGKAIDTSDPLTMFAESLCRGRIGALKGLGGYHLVCAAGNEQAVSELRRRKQRDEKPLAMMVRDATAARRWCEVDPHEQLLLESPQRPIVILKKRDDPCLERIRIADSVAPGNPRWGIVLPYTPLHYLLMEAMKDEPLVMTSGNRSDEPIAYRDDDAIERLGSIADVFLTHNRPIQMRCDDSVTCSVDGLDSPIRRSRGAAPLPIALPFDCPRPLLAVGGQFKNVFAFGHQRRAILSHHLGDLDQFEVYQDLETSILVYEQLFDIHPAVIVHDRHPDYASTVYARQRALDTGLDVIAVQHHHAHMASCMAEHGLDEPVIGVIFDGTGFGLDETIWGGEFLVGDYAQFRRAAHFRQVRMPGGAQAVREPWRMAMAHLVDAGCDTAAVTGVSSHQRRTVEQMLARGFHSPMTSSVGRLFDAVAAIIGLRTHVSYEGQAAMQLEWLATDVPEEDSYPFGLSEYTTSAGDRETADASPVSSLDTRPMIRAVIRDQQHGIPAAIIARRFHATLVEMIASTCGQLRSQTGLDAVVLSGGVFMNALLTRAVPCRLRKEGFRVYRHHLVPPGDGGLSLGQLAIAAKSLRDD